MYPTVKVAIFQTLDHSQCSVPFALITGPATDSSYGDKLFCSTSLCAPTDKIGLMNASAKIKSPVPPSVPPGLRYTVVLFYRIAAQVCNCALYYSYVLQKHLCPLCRNFGNALKVFPSKYFCLKWSIKFVKRAAVSRVSNKPKYQA